ncbi:LPS assembly lipoprotein LptE [Salinicola salarius]|jgi:LPS-assembly lipoprotein|uniref:LPS-assembly lipoprotein LptE n=1 Tax=Salinicola salarius TaxID=430457 RepID=UPI000DA1F631|nr:LPS assembly lipoprotein LptE [Salinicola salarius]MDF3919919.1 LPS assembly lipoprotein LptE [Salinicola salarius]
MMRRTVLAGLMAVSLTALAGCGFQLRGLNQPTLAIPELNLNANVSPFSEEVRRALENAGTRISETADIRVNLGDERISENRLTRSDSGSRETEVTLTAPFSVQRESDDAYLLNQQQLEASTTVLLSTDDIYSGEEVRTEAIRQLRRDAATQLIDRLDALETP